MKRKNNKKLKLLSLLFIVLFVFISQTIVYSAINSTMTIKGNAYARPVKDVRITNFKLNSLSGGTSVSYAEFSSNTISTKIHLVDGYSTAKFDVEVTNYGNVDVGILSINNDTNADVRYDLYNYEITEKLCDENDKCNNMAVKTFQIEVSGIPGDYELIYTFDFRTYHNITYTGITNNNYPTEVIDGGRLNIKFTEDLNKIAFLKDGIEFDYYDQISSGQNITINNVSSDIEIKKEPVARLVSGKINEVGSEVCIKDECFYIISNDGTKVSMLAKYNLYVGGIYDKESKTWTKYGEEATGIQNPNMRGFFDIDSNRQGTTEFSNDEDKGNNNNDYVGSLVEKYIKEYNQYLSNLTEDVITTRLITKEELVLIGCDLTEGQCNNNHNWILYTSYWTMSPGREDRIYYIHKNNYFNDDKYTTQNSYGVRPVIEMSVDDIYVPPVATVVSGNLDTVGSEVCIKEECFYVISSTDTTVTMLSKYNLHVGNSVDSDWNVTPLASPTGIQDEIAKGLVNGEYPFIGTTAFSNVDSTYEGSIVEGYVNSYSSYLITQGVTPIDARLITEDELVGLGCSNEDMSCSEAPSWVYATSYWSGSSGNSDDVYCVFSYSHFSNGFYSDDGYCGVRPVITISNDYFKK